MKRFVLLTLLLVVCGTTFSQQLRVVKELYKDENNTLAVKYPRKDTRGDNCGLILVGLVMPDAKFEGNIVYKEYKQGEWWIYMPKGSTSFTVNDVLRCSFSPIESNATYLMTIVRENKDAVKNYLVIRTNNSSSKIFVDNEYMGKGECSSFLDVSKKYTYRIETPLHHTEEGVLELSEDKTTELNITLRPAYGYLQINTFPEQGATIEINGEEYAEVTPFTTKAFASGVYKIQAFKQMYKPVMVEAVVEDGKTTQVDISLVSNYGNVLIVLADGDAMLYVDDKYISQGTWQGSLTAGEHIIEARKDNYYTFSKKLNVIEGQTGKVSIPPLQYKSGKLNVNSNPIGADIKIDGKDYGRTPKVVQNIITGTHSISISKAGYATYTANVEVEEDKMAEVSCTLVKGVDKTTQPALANITTGQQGDSVYVNKKYIGKSPINKYSLKAGKYTIEARRNGAKVSKDINVNANNGQTMNVVLEFPKQAVASSNTDSQKEDDEQSKADNYRIKNRCFFTGDYVSTLNQQTAYGLTIGKVYNGSLGWYISAVSNLVDGFSITRELRTNDIYDHYYTGETKVMRHSATLGVLLGGRHFYWKLGGGYGMRNMMWYTSDGKWYNVMEDSYEGIEITTGFQLMLWRFVISADVLVPIDKFDIQGGPFYWEARAGVGFNF